MSYMAERVCWVPDNHAYCWVGDTQRLESCQYPLISSFSTLQRTMYSLCIIFMQLLNISFVTIWFSQVDITSLENMDNVLIYSFLTNMYHLAQGSTQTCICHLMNVIDLQIWKVKSGQAVLGGVMQSLEYTAWIGENLPCCFPGTTTS